MHDRWYILGHSIRNLNLTEYMSSAVDDPFYLILQFILCAMWSVYFNIVSCISMLRFTAEVPRFWTRPEQSSYHNFICLVHKRCLKNTISVAVSLDKQPWLYISHGINIELPKQQLTRKIFIDHCLNSKIMYLRNCNRKHKSSWNLEWETLVVFLKLN